MIQVHRLPTFVAKFRKIKQRAENKPAPRSSLWFTRQPTRSLSDRAPYAKLNAGPRNDLLLRRS
jgi:hypothetical protein